MQINEVYHVYKAIHNNCNFLEWTWDKDSYPRKNEKELFKKEHMIYFSFSNSISNISQVEGLNIYDWIQNANEN